MSDILAIVDQNNTDELLVEEIARRHPDRVTVLLEDGQVDSRLDDSPRAAPGATPGKAAAAIEQRTGAVVVGLAGSASSCAAGAFDRIVGAMGRSPRSEAGVPTRSSVN